MRIALIGYGKMGREIEAVATQRGHSVVRIDPNTPEADYRAVSKDALKGADVAIDFTLPSAVVDNIKAVASCGVDMVVGTTGWYERMDEVAGIAKKGGIGLIWSGNFSIGMNVFFELVRHGARLMDRLDAYDVLVHETHHAKKADSPSGTAEMLGKILLDSMSRKTALARDRLDRPIAENEIHLTSTRGGHIPGIHEVMFDSPADTIELKHTARSRAGFAFGAVLAAEFIRGRKGMHTADHLMASLLEASQ